jgi:(p)ppGpp synthase/HD superfamily hydrolase
MEAVTRYMSGAERLRVRLATEVAFQAHNGQVRRSKEPFVVHPVAVAIILAELEMDCDTVIAGLLHDTVEVCNFETKYMFIQGCIVGSHLVSLCLH